jgi:DNA-binding transcriptional ArsR family regulator
MLTTEAITKIRAEQGDQAADQAIRDDRRQSEEDKKQRARRENRDFTMVYPAGWQRIRSLLKLDPNAAALYAFFAEQMGPDGTLCASRGTLAEALGVGERTVSRHVASLEKIGAIVVLKVGTANVYCLNPAEVWKSFANSKPYAAFSTKTLVGKTENPYVKRRLATLLKGKVPEVDQPDLFSDADSVGFDMGTVAGGSDAADDLPEVLTMAAE